MTPIFRSSSRDMAAASSPASSRASATEAAARGTARETCGRSFASTYFVSSNSSGTWPATLNQRRRPPRARRRGQIRAAPHLRERAAGGGRRRGKPHLRLVGLLPRLGRAEARRCRQLHLQGARRFRLAGRAAARSGRAGARAGQAHPEGARAAAARRPRTAARRAQHQQRPVQGQGPRRAGEDARQPKRGPHGADHAAGGAGA